jgi:hypothetical protein
MRTIPLAILFIALVSESVAGSELPVDPDFSEHAIRQWIADWDSPLFSVRREASRRVREAGLAAFPVLVDAMRNGSHETIARAMELLKASLHPDNPELQAAARKSLDQIAAGQHAMAARSARQVLRDFENPPSQYANLRQWGAPAANLAKRINTWTFNGTTTLEAFENEVSIKIQTDPNGRIKMEFRQKRQGLDVTSRYEGANAADLKARHPAAHQLYQKYEPSLQQARLMAQRPRQVPAVLQLPAPGALPVQGIFQQVQVHEVQIAVLQQRLAQVREPALAAALQRALEIQIESRNQLLRQINRR